MAKICRPRPDSGVAHKKSNKARAATCKKPGEDKDEPAIHEARAHRSELGTPKLLL